MTGTNTEPDGIRIDDDGGVRIVTIDRQAKRNALTPSMVNDLRDAFDDASFDSGVRVLVVTGAGEKAFSAGIDLAAIDDDPGLLARLPMGGAPRNLFEVVVECRKPTIAAINGDAVGGGCELALAVDLRIASPHARFGLPEARRGMGANFGAHMLPRIVGRGHAFELLYTGDLIDAERAHDIGLVGDVARDGRSALEQALALARRIEANAPLTVQRYKANVTRGADLPLSAALRLDVGPNPYLSADREEGVRAFLEHRAPRWEGR